MSNPDRPDSSTPLVIRLTCVGCGWDFWTAREKSSTDTAPTLCGACRARRPVREKALFIERKPRGESVP